MKQAKFILIAAGVIGIIACFLPYIKEGSFSIKYWDVHKMHDSAMVGLLNGSKQVYIAMVGFGVTALMGVLALPKLMRWHGIVALVFSLVAFVCEGVRKGMSSEHGVHTAIGGKLLFLAAIVGAIGGLIAAIKPEDA